MSACDPSAHLVRSFPLLEVSVWVNVSTRSPLSVPCCGCSTTSWSCCTNRGSSIIVWDFFWHYLLGGNLLSLSTTKYLTFSLLLKAFHASCTSSAYKFLASTPICFIFPTVTKLSRKIADFKLAISPSSKLQFSQFFYFYFGSFSIRNPNLLFISKNFVQKFSDLLYKLLAQKLKLWNLLFLYIVLPWSPVLRYHVEFFLQIS